MNRIIKKYKVQHPILKNYIKFYWELKIEQAELNHKIIPQRNINLRINLNETPQYANVKGSIQLLDDVNFSGLQNKNINTSLKLRGNVHVMGICFYPEGFFPFFNIPVNEFKNQLLGAREIGLRLLNEINEQLIIKANLINKFLEKQDGFIDSELVKAVESSIWYFIYHIEKYAKIISGWRKSP